VRADMSDALDRIAPYDKKGNLYRHSAEGEDDMPVGFLSLSSLLFSSLGLFLFLWVVANILVMRCVFRLILNLPWSVHRSMSPSVMAVWRRGRGRGFGTWSSDIVATVGRSL
jgi:hypothetical protein